MFDRIYEEAGCDAVSPLDGSSLSDENLINFDSSWHTATPK